MLLFPHAKINIGLNIVRKRPDGYHDLETVFYPIPLQDVLETKPLKGSNAPYLFQLAGNDIQTQAEDNLVVKVYMAMKEEFDLPAIDIYLYKRIPTGAGLGGGSSDAAQMMKAINEDFDLGLTEVEMERRIAAFGADCAFFIQGRPVYATGIGERLTPLDFSLKGMTIVLVKPSLSVSTKAAYQHVVPRQPEKELREAIQAPVEQWRTTVFNDFEDYVFTAYPQIAAIKSTLYDMGAVYASMSGSGSSVYGLFNIPPADAREIFPDCFVFQQKIRE